MRRPTRRAVLTAGAAATATAASLPVAAGAVPIPDLGLRIREAIARVNEAERICIRFDNSNADANRQLDARWVELRALEGQIPNPPRSLWDIVARAEIAYLGADKDRDDGRIMVWHPEDCFEGPAGRLVEAVLQFAEVRHV